MYRLRFNLSAGKHFMHWQLKNRGEVSYFKPDEVTIRAYNITLRNNPNVSRRIFDGAHKSVCAWLDCEFIDISPVENIDGAGLTHLSFNPKNFPHWTLLGENYGWNLDGKYIGNIVTIGRNVLTAWAPDVIIGVSPQTIR